MATQQGTASPPRWALISLLLFLYVNGSLDVIIPILVMNKVDHFGGLLREVLGMCNDNVLVSTIKDYVLQNHKWVSRVFLGLVCSSILCRSNLVVISLVTEFVPLVPTFILVIYTLLSTPSTPFMKWVKKVKATLSQQPRWMHLVIIFTLMFLIDLVDNLITQVIPPITKIVTTKVVHCKLSLSLLVNVNDVLKPVEDFVTNNGESVTRVSLVTVCCLVALKNSLLIVSLSTDFIPVIPLCVICGYYSYTHMLTAVTNTTDSSKENSDTAPTTGTSADVETRDDKQQMIAHIREHGDTATVRDLLGWGFTQHQIIKYQVRELNREALHQEGEASTDAAASSNPLAVVPSSAVNSSTPLNDLTSTKKRKANGDTTVAQPSTKKLKSRGSSNVTSASNNNKRKRKASSARPKPSPKKVKESSD